VFNNVFVNIKSQLSYFYFSDLCKISHN
jgi:hypothetical protein